MPLFYGDFEPSPGFAFTRSYVAGIAFAFDTGTAIANFGNRYAAISPGLDTAVEIEVDERIYAPSSNHYTLDYVVTVSLYGNPPSPIVTPLPFLLYYFVTPDDGFPWLIYAPFHSLGSSLFKFPWPNVPGQWNRFPWNTA